MLNAPPIIILIFGLVAGATSGYLVGRITRENFNRRIRSANTRMRSMELDRDQLRRDLDEKQAELLRALADRGDVKRQDREMVVVFENNDTNDLTHIKGIGPKTASILITEGIETTEDLARLTERDLELLSDRWPGLVARMVREGWRESAEQHLSGESFEEESFEEESFEEESHQADEAEPELVEERVQADEHPDHASSSPPKDVPAEVEEPDPALEPDLEYPPVRFG